MRFTHFGALGWIAAALLAIAPSSCSDDPLQNHAASSSTSGAGGGGGGACVPAPRPCAVAFRFPFHNEHSVVLRGDFAPDGWTNGVPMALDGAEWKASLDLEDGRKVHYKFFVDGASWVTD